MPDRRPGVVDRGLAPVYETVRALCSEHTRAWCDAELAEFLIASPEPATATRRPRPSARRSWLCSLRHRRDANLAVGLAAATPPHQQETLDRSLLALLRASATYHRERCRRADPPDPAARPGTIDLTRDRDV